jgi:hypothetical protein
MPAFGTGLGCESATFTWLNETVVRDVAVGTAGDHSFDVRGAGAGTVLVTAAPAGQADVSYEVRVRASSAALADTVRGTWPAASAESRVVLGTPAALGGGDGCVRYDAVIRVPAGVRKLHVQAHAKAHVKLAGGADALQGLEDLFVTLYTGDADNVLVSSEDVWADRIAFKALRGYIVGGVSISEVCIFGRFHALGDDLEHSTRRLTRRAVTQSST